MARKSIEERLAQLDAQRQALKSRLTTQERAKDTRRKVLLGALVLHHLSEDKREFDKALKEWLQRELPGFLTRPDDKALFNDLLNAPAETPVQEAAITTHDPSQADLLAAATTPGT